jgi:nucleoside-diphosphate-sugar epimerase
MGELTDKAVLITGAAGCIGATVVKQLSEIGAVPVVYDLTEDRSRLHLIMDDADDVVWESGDITDYDNLNAIIQKHNIYAIIHLAALQVPFCKADPVLSAKVNVVGTTNILEAARQNGIKRLTYASSIAAPAMGNNDHLATLYGAHKICGEQMAAVYWQDWRIPSIGIRPGVIYGPGRDQGMSAAPTIAMLAAFEGQSYTVPFSGPVAFVHVEDAASRFIGAVSVDIENAFVFDMQGTPMAVEKVVELVKSKVPNCRVKVSGNPLPFGYQVDDGRLDKLVGVAPYMPMAEGIRQTLDTFRSAHKRGVLTTEHATSLIEKNS